MKVLHAILRLLLRIPYGLARLATLTWAWCTDRKYQPTYEQAITAQPGQIERFRKARADRQRKRICLLIMALGLAFIGLLLADDYMGNGAVWQTLIACIIVTAAGIGKVPARIIPGATNAPAATGGKQPWGGSLDGLEQALVDAGLLKPDQHIDVVQMPHEVGKGVAGIAQLPGGLSVAQCVSRKERIASGLAVDSTYLKLSKGANDGQLKFWAPLGDPFKSNTRPLPLITEEKWNSWKAAPFAFTADDKTVYQRLMYSNMLIGSKPGAGKTFAARCAIAPYILDPTVNIYVANGKFDGAWEVVKPFAVRYIRGRADQQALELNDMLADVQAEMDRRFLEHMDDASKVTEGMGLSPILVVVDELQNYTTNSLPVEKPLRGKKATIGQWIDHRLVDIVKNGRAAGVILVLITQRPSEESLSTELRAQVGTRMALKTMDFQTSNMILGQVSKRGIDASELDPQHKGVGIYVPDMEEDLLDESIGAYPTVRTFLCSDEDWAAICARGRRLREAADMLPEIEPTIELPAIEAAPTPEPVSDDITSRVRQVWPPDEDRLWTEELLDLLRAEHPQDYSEHTTASLPKLIGRPAKSVRKNGAVKRGYMLHDLDV